MLNILSFIQATLSILLFSLLYFRYIKPAQEHCTILILPLISLISGILLQKTLPLDPLFLAITILGLYPLLFFTKKISNKYLRHTPEILIFFTTGALLLSLQIGAYHIDMQTLPKKNEPFTALVIDKANFTEQPYKEMVKLSIEKTDKTVCGYFQQQTQMQPGDIVLLKNCIFNHSKQKKSLSGNPSFADYMVKEHILGTTFIKHPSYTIVSNNNTSLPQKLYRYRSIFLKKLQQKMPPQTFSLFSSIFLGIPYNEKLQNTRKRFQEWGISHQLARSGLHIALFVFIWKYLLSLFPLFFALKQIFLLILCTLYAALSWPSIAFLRAFALFFLYVIGILLKKTISFSHLLVIIIFAVLLKNPIQLFFIDFQLSFGLTFALSLFFSSPYKHR